MIASLTAVTAALAVAIPILILGEAIRRSEELPAPPRGDADLGEVHISPEALAAARQRLDLTPGVWSYSQQLKVASFASSDQADGAN